VTSPKTLNGRRRVEHYRVERVVDGKWALLPGAKNLTLPAAKTYWMAAKLQLFSARVVTDDERAIVKIKPDGEET
jgi:hypothetical protein